ncbi:MAG: SIS domain-containing protein [Granulosicoccaceae bacterium]
MASQQLHQRLQLLQRAEEALSSALEQAAETLVQTVVSGGKVMVCGDEAGYCTASEFTHKLVHTYQVERPPLPACLLTTEFTHAEDALYERQVQALGKSEDTLVCLLGGQDSRILTRAIYQAHTLQLPVIVLDNTLARPATAELWEQDVEICAPCDTPALVRELQLTLVHCLCEAIDLQLFGAPTN